MCKLGTCIGCQYGQSALNSMIINGIQQNGFVVIPIVDENTVYTVGLTETFHRPEFIISGMDMRMMCNVIISAIDRLKEDINAFNGATVSRLIKIRKDGNDDSVEDSLVACRLVTEKCKHDYMGQAIKRYGIGGFEGKQLIIPDQNGILPTDPNCDLEWRKVQPRLY